jgi:putative transposase
MCHSAPLAPRVARSVAHSLREWSRCNFKHSRSEWTTEHNHSRSEWTTMCGPQCVNHDEGKRTMIDTGMPLRFFEPGEEYFVVERKDLPHWVQAGTLCFLTWRTWDSMPAEVLADWLARRNAWLSEHGVDPAAATWREHVRRLPLADQHAFHSQVSARWEACLDECHGDCPLRTPALGRVVADSLAHFDGDRYALTDFVVMPNHVHVLAAFPSADRMLEQVESWKHYTAVRINRALGRRGRFWQVDGFDHLVRRAQQYDYLRRYIQDNPRRAGLQPGEYIHHQVK